MKNKLLVVLAIGMIVSCTPPHKEELKSESQTTRTLITSCIESTFILRDTTTIKNLSKDEASQSIFQYHRDRESYVTFLTEPEFAVIRSSIKELAKNPQEYLYHDVNEKPLTKEEISFRLVQCDSVVESNFDATGKEVMIKRWMCDSVTMPNLINMIKFYEAWYINNETKLIEKDLLGYAVYAWDDFRKGYRNLFYAFKSKDALQMAKSKLSYY